MTSRQSRREVLRLGAAGVGAALAGCSGDPSGALPVGGGDTEATPTAYEPIERTYVTLPRCSSNGDDGAGGADGQASDADSSAGTWSAFGHDAANTGHDPEASGPKRDAGVDWTFHGGTPTMLSSPVLVDGTVYAAPTGGEAGLAAVDVESGEEDWSVDLRESPGGAPVVADGVVYVGTYGYRFYAVDATSGEVRWERFVGTRIVRSAPVYDDGTVYTGTSGPSVLALDAETGDEVWRHGESGDGTGSGSSPAVADGLVVFGAGDTLFALDAETGELAWSADVGTHPGATPAIADGRVYYGAPSDRASTPCRVWALDLQSGETEWTYDVEDESLRTAPAVADGTVYVSASSVRACLRGMDEDQCSGVTRGRLYAVDAGTGDEEWVARTRTDTRSSPAVADGVVYVGCDGGVSAVTTDGDHAWRVDLADHSPEGDRVYLDSSPAVGGCRLYVGASDGRLYALGETGA